MVTFVTPFGRIAALLGPEGAVVTGGYGGWEQVARPGQKSYVDWNGIAPLTMDVNFLLDGFALDESVEAQVSALESVAVQLPGATQPHSIRLEGPVPHTEIEWVVEGFSWEAALRRADGARVRQPGTASLLELVHADIALILSPARAARQVSRKTPSATHGKTYVVMSGDTLMTIAARKLGSGKRWGEIAKLNKIRDPRAIRVGQKLTLP